MVTFLCRPLLGHWDAGSLVSNGDEHHLFCGAITGLAICGRFNSYSSSASVSLPLACGGSWRRASKSSQCIARRFILVAELSSTLPCAALSVFDFVELSPAAAFPTILPQSLLSTSSVERIVIDDDVESWLAAASRSRDIVIDVPGGHRPAAIDPHFVCIVPDRVGEPWLAAALSTRPTLRWHLYSPAWSNMSSRRSFPRLVQG
jgi:hypothetical protein